MLAVALTQQQKVEITKVELVRSSAPDVEVTLARDKHLELRIILVVPETGRDIEGLEIMADNLMPGYWDHRQPPNLFVTALRLDADGNAHPAPARILTSGGGQDLRVHFEDLSIELLDTPEHREKRIREFIEHQIPRDRLTMPVDTVVRAFERLYIGNPVGKYRLDFEYREPGRASAHRSVIVEVNDGPDVLDDLAAKR